MIDTLRDLMKYQITKYEDFYRNREQELVSKKLISKDTTVKKVLVYFSITRNYMTEEKKDNSQCLIKVSLRRLY